MINNVLNSFCLIIGFMSVMFIVATIKRDNSLVDIGWGWGFIIIYLYNYIQIDEPSLRQSIITALIIIWGLRLSLYIYYRNRGKKEDFRYAKWRKQWGKLWLIRSFLQVFILQGIILFLIAYPVFFLHNNSKNILFLDIMGIILWVIGFTIEAVSDWQKNIFKKDDKNKRKILKTGLWKYSRHPNYFGEVLVWWAIFILILNYDYGWLAVFSPITITCLILFISGIPLLEEKHKNNKEYQEYARKTSIFIPWIPKK